MNSEEIYKLLKSRFGAAVCELVIPSAGDTAIQIAAEALVEVGFFLRDEPELAFDFLRLVTAVDRGEKLSSVYHLYSYKNAHGLVLRVDVPRERPLLDSVAAVWPAADWLEREAFDMLGIVYQGHPNLERILLPLDWEGHPLRKDYKHSGEYHGVKHEG
jgi:NADH-quinone oxidoreductase subunit C